MSATTEPQALSRENVIEAVEHLEQTAKGRRAMGALNVFLSEGALGLDQRNQNALIHLLTGAFSGRAGTVDDLTREYRPKKGTQS